MKKIVNVLLIGIMTLSLVACESSTQSQVKNVEISDDNIQMLNNADVADTVVYGTIWTAEDNDTVEAFAVKDGRYIYVGDKEGTMPFIKENVTKVIDNTDNGLVIPGCTEGHGHFIGLDGIFRLLPGYLVDYEQLLDIVKEEINKNPKTEFFLSWGFNYTKFVTNQDFKKSYAEEIENIAKDIPVFLFDSSGHQALCNVTALKVAGLYDNPKIRGGIVELTEEGVPNGMVKDDAVFYVLAKAIDLSKIDAEIFRKACKNAVDELHKRGFTNYFDAYLNALHDNIFYKYIKELDEKDELNINMGACYTVRSYDIDEYEDKIDHVVELADEYHTDHFNPYNIKLFADGVVEAQTGWILDEYPNVEADKKHGNMVWEKDELSKVVKVANKNGISVHTHSFGDAACKNMIDIYIDANKSGNNKVHNTLGHVRNITDEDIKRCADNNIGIAENLIWHEGGSKEFAELMTNLALPAGYYENGYPMKSLIDAGVLVSSSTDAPAGEAIEGNIFNIIEVATTGIAPTFDNEAFNTKELLTVREVLDCLTINGARQMGIDDRCGSIKIGKNADFIILDTNFLDYKGEELRRIHETKIKDVYFEGKKCNK